jgi:hypothetical protein
MKYKRLTTEELNALEKEFIHFLSSAQITGKDWERIKKEDPEKAEELVEVFSDLVYDKVLGKINFLEYLDNKTLNIFKCETDKISLVGIRVKENSLMDLRESDVFSNWDDNKTASISIVRSEKKYKETKESEVFELLQNGCVITNQKRFDLLSGLLKK